MSRTTLVVKTDEGQFKLFTIDNNTTRPASIPINTTVQVVSTPTDNPDLRLADTVTIVKTAAGAAPTEQDNVPASVRHAEAALKREASFFKLGFQGGFTLNPELVSIGMHAKFGPIFSRNLFFRPSIEYDWGEVSRLFGINADVVFRATSNRDYFYFGGGPAFNFVGLTFGNFSDFKYDAALNILAGYQFRSGLFTEVRTAVYARPAPVFHLTVGYTF